MNLGICALIALVLISLALILLLKQYRPEFALLASVTSALILLIYGIAKAGEIISAVRSLTERAGIDEQNVLLVLKALGICYIVQIAKDVCADSGQTALSDRIDFIGKVTVVAMSLPLLTQIIGIVTQLLV
ncbi:MAG: SpoIIIAC/SpoIIIAD family protein [Acutalibacteraceae bacterium]|nr:SpoIIIAC/SpoIIIAD family protein [Acutalibacteraceae bacterium]